VSKKIERWWYQRTLSWQLIPLIPFSLLFTFLAALRRGLFFVRLKRTWKAPVPVIIVGNVTVGGTGKTPTVLAVIELLKQLGLKPGIVSRGYGSEGPYPALVDHESTAQSVGDEPIMLQRLSGVPVVVDPKRVEAAKALLAHYEVDVIVADDGLQHYALGRHVELGVVDGQRGFGNGWRIPTGPLRERIARLKKVDWVLLNTPTEQVQQAVAHLPQVVNMQLATKGWRRVSDDSVIEVPDGETAVVIAGIGHPERFFNSVKEQGIHLAETRVYADHYQYTPQDFYDVSNQYPVLMTEKDAVKVRSFARPHWYYLKVEMAFPEAFKTAFGECVLNIRNSLQKESSNERSRELA